MIKIFTKNHNIQSFIKYSLFLYGMMLKSKQINCIYTRLVVKLLLKLIVFLTNCFWIVQFLSYVSILQLTKWNSYVKIYTKRFLSMKAFLWRNSKLITAVQVKITTTGVCCCRHSQLAVIHSTLCKRLLSFRFHWIILWGFSAFFWKLKRKSNCT